MRLSFTKGAFKRVDPFFILYWNYIRWWYAEIFFAHVVLNRNQLQMSDDVSSRRVSNRLKYLINKFSKLKTIFNYKFVFVCAICKNIFIKNVATWKLNEIRGIFVHLNIRISLWSFRDQLSIVFFLDDFFIWKLAKIITNQFRRPW